MLYLVIIIIFRINVQRYYTRENVTGYRPFFQVYLTQKNVLTEKIDNTHMIIYLYTICLPKHTV